MTRPRSHLPISPRRGRGRFVSFPSSLTLSSILLLVFCCSNVGTIPTVRGTFCTCNTSTAPTPVSLPFAYQTLPSALAVWAAFYLEWQLGGRRSRSSGRRRGYQPTASTHPPHHLFHVIHLPLWPLALGRQLAWDGSIADVQLVQSNAR